MKVHTLANLCLLSVIMTSMLMSCDKINKHMKDHHNLPPFFSHTKGKGWKGVGSCPFPSGSKVTAPGTNMTNLAKVLQNNRKWVAKNTAVDPNFFLKHKPSQNPTYMWVGCSDSRVPPNQILGLGIGEVFVLRNVANIASPSDISSLAVMQYTVEELKVTDILIAGHYGCGGISASLQRKDYGPLNAWLIQLKRLRHTYAKELSKYKNPKKEAKRLVELNVQEQVMNTVSTPFVQRAWKAGQQLRVHGVIYDMATGKLIDQKITMSNLNQIPKELRIV